MNWIFLELETYEVGIYQDSEIGRWQFFKKVTHIKFSKEKKTMKFIKIK